LPMSQQYWSLEAARASTWFFESVGNPSGRR
jgi:hypothetical protein